MGNMLGFVRVSLGGGGVASLGGGCFGRGFGREIVSREYRVVVVVVCLVF